MVSGERAPVRVLLTLTRIHGHCSFVVIKLILGVNLLSYATRRRADMEARAAADVVNDFGRDPIGEGTEEQVCSSLLPTLSLCIADLAHAEIQPRPEDDTRQRAR